MTLVETMQPQAEPALRHAALLGFPLALGRSVFIS